MDQIRTELRFSMTSNEIREKLRENAEKVRKEGERDGVPALVKEYLAKEANELLWYAEHLEEGTYSLRPQEVVFFRQANFAGGWAPLPLPLTPIEPESGLRLVASGGELVEPPACGRCGHCSGCNGDEAA